MSTFFVRLRKGDVCFGVHGHDDAGKMDIHPPYMEDSLRGLRQCWFQDAVGVGRFLVSVSTFSKREGS